MPTSAHVQRKTELNDELMQYIPYLTCAEDIFHTAQIAGNREVAKKSAKNERLLVAQNAGVSL